jgi:hypothetical protein
MEAAQDWNGNDLFSSGSRTIRNALAIWNSLVDALMRP